MTVTMTTHHVSGYVVHAEAGWANGNSPTGLALAVHLHSRGAATPSHVVHAGDVTCGHCPPVKMCKRCKEPVMAHCLDCMVCNPDEAEHPSWCGQDDE